MKEILALTAIGLFWVLLVFLPWWVVGVALAVRVARWLGLL